MGKWVHYPENDAHEPVSFRISITINPQVQMIRREDVSSRMYTITYRNVLKQDKVIEDFHSWLKSYWPFCQCSGAKSLRLWRYQETGKVVLLWQLTIDNLERWQNHILDKSVQGVLRDLDSLTESGHLGVEVRHLPGKQSLPVNYLFPLVLLN